MIAIVFFWFALAIIVGIAANTRGRSGGGWFLAALIFSPLLAGLLLLALPRKDNSTDGGEIILSSESEEYEQQRRRTRRLVTWAIIVVVIIFSIWLSQVQPPHSSVQLSPEEFSRLRKSIQKCWNVPSGRPAPAVRVRVLLNLDGTLSGNPIVMNSEPNSAFRAAADEAVRAIRQCQPYQMPPASFEAWKDVEVRFDPN